MVGGLVYFWEQWDIEILVVLSFCLQVILLLLAGIRRREGSALLRILLWLAYQMADFTAIYALGHMSISSRSREQQIVAFWSPFLLLHLGGPDTITAYAFEDNQLWLRHLPTLVGQVTGAAYVLYQFIAAGRNPVTLLVAAILMFISGFLKYGERTWALNRASIESIASSLGKSHAASRRNPYHGRERGKRLDAEDVLLGAHYVFNVCKSQFVDGLEMEVPEYEAIAQGIELNGDMYMYELVEMELSLMYDILYTKAAVIHTWYGYCIRIFSSLSAVAALLLFQLSSKDAYSRADIIITYVLLVGALVLEVATSVRAAGSSWACASFHARGWHRLESAAMRLRRLLRAAGRRRRRTCLDSLGQYNLLDLCIRHMNDRAGKIAMTIGLEDLWNKLHYASTIHISQDIKAMLLEEIQKRRRREDMGKARGGRILEEKGVYKDLKWCVDNIELDHSILVWHIATDLYLSRCPEEEEATQMLRSAIRVLSNHMLFLLVVHPYMLPGVVRHGRYKENYLYFSELWRVRSTQEDRMNPSQTMKARKIAGWQLPDDSSYLSGTDDGSAADGRASVDGTRLAGMLLANKWSMAIPDMLQLIAGVWVEMLCYAGHHCGEESHARKLSSGGEFMTAIWIIMGHASMYDQIVGSSDKTHLAGVMERMAGPPNIWVPVPREEWGPYN